MANKKIELLFFKDSSFVDFLYPQELLILSQINKSLKSLINSSEWIWKHLCKNILKTTQHTAETNYRSFFFLAWKRDVEFRSVWEAEKKKKA
jgi:hypothetical protein